MEKFKGKSFSKIFKTQPYTFGNPRMIKSRTQGIQDGEFATTQYNIEGKVHLI